MATADLSNNPVPTSTVNANESGSTLPPAPDKYRGAVVEVQSTQSNQIKKVDISLMFYFLFSFCFCFLEKKKIHYIGLAITAGILFTWY